MDDTTREPLDRAAVANLAAVRTRIAAACARSRRDPASVRLIAVVKQRPLEQVRALIRAGALELAENRPLDARDRVPQLPAGPLWHMIGRLQTNKSKYLPPIFEWVHSIDRHELADGVSDAYWKAGKRALGCLQINVSGEEVKAGVGPEDAEDFVRHCLALPGLDVRGLMTMAPLEAEPEATRPVFRALRALRHQLEAEVGHPLPELSMGMSNDFEVAVEEGATMARVGSALFAGMPE
ncbi:MAG: YggS family pyridoxal phosphate-dependent enzyme [Candidatus Sumerlaeia bacterium]|nr:YggS family pyridoxal phosphate-dependent enzyme [Candidatus Sumerlaeia bacterium]